MTHTGGSVHTVATSSHWGTYQVVVDDDTVVSVQPDPADPEPAPVMNNVPTAQHHTSRISRPAVRRAWLEHGPGPDEHRGDRDDEYVEVDWERALDLLAGELDRVRTHHGNQAIFGGSYGWGSAGRFHHAQSQLHRFLNAIGGYTASRTTYSHGTSEVLFPHLVGVSGLHDILSAPATWDVIARETDLLVSFGGLRTSNTWSTSGGRGANTAGGGMRAAVAAGTKVVSISPIRDDTADELGAEWLPAAPGTDTAILLALMHVLFEEDLADSEFLDRYTVGAKQLRTYVSGAEDGVAKSPEWAAEITELPATTLRELARRMSRGRTLLNIGWSVQRARFGERPLWAGLALAACLGQIGLPGGGFASGYGSMGNYGGGATPLGLPRFPQGTNKVRTFIPVARIADALLRPGEEYDFNGQRLTYPDLRLVYWAGGNPFHHHQNLKRLTRAFQQPDTVVVNETHWTATARHADIVLPATTSLEREDFAISQGDLTLRAMRRAVSPHAEARDEYDTFTDLARRLSAADTFTEGRTATQWQERIYRQWRDRMDAGLPDFAEFWKLGAVEVPHRGKPESLFQAFRTDPEQAPLRTPSGRIELYSETIASFGYADCPGLPTWAESPESLGAPRAAQFPLVLIANQPSGRLHSQQDMGSYSQSQKVRGRAPVRIHPDDARQRGLADGAVVRIRNDRGSCLAGVVLCDALRPGVVQLSTGAWYDPSAPTVADCVHGNPNVLTADAGTSSLSQGCAAQHVLVEVEPYAGSLPPVRAFESPVGVDQD